MPGFSSRTLLQDSPPGFSADSSPPGCDSQPSRFSKNKTGGKMRTGPYARQSGASAQAEPSCQQRGAAGLGQVGLP
eukprot:1656169-Karenia_brevis.AAC.1